MSRLAHPPNRPALGDPSDVASRKARCRWRSAHRPDHRSQTFSFCFPCPCGGIRPGDAEPCFAEFFHEFFIVGPAPWWSHAMSRCRRLDRARYSAEAVPIAGAAPSAGASLRSDRPKWQHPDEISRKLKLLHRNLLNEMAFPGNCRYSGIVFEAGGFRWSQQYRLSTGHGLRILQNVGTSNLRSVSARNSCYFCRLFFSACLQSTEDLEGIDGNFCSDAQSSGHSNASK